MSTKLPATRILSWAQQVKEADPNWQRGLTHPWIYQFSNGRKFVWNPSVYTSTN